MEILNKPGKLTDEEWKIMRSHVEKGYDIANSNVELKQIAEEIRHHHERWDGKGYPDGLSRESIPVLSRVIAVVDAFAAVPAAPPEAVLSLPEVVPPFPDVVPPFPVAAVSASFSVVIR